METALIEFLLVKITQLALFTVMLGLGLDSAIWQVLYL